MNGSAEQAIPGDQALRSELQQSISEQLDESSAVRVFVFGDFAWLLGEVSNPLAQLLAEDIAYAQPGIARVFNEVVVRSAEAQAAA